MRRMWLAPASLRLATLLPQRALARAAPSVWGSAGRFSQRRCVTGGTTPPTDAAAPGAAPQAPATPSVSEALRLLRSQPNHYVVASIAGRTMVLTAADLVTVPHLRDTQVGDVLELDRVHEVGGRDYTLRAQDPSQGRRNPNGGRYPLVLLRHEGKPELAMRAANEAGQPLGAVYQAENATITPFSRSWAANLVPSGLAHVGAALSPEVVRVRCVVTEHAKGPMERIVKFKRRKGYEKTVTHKQPYTRIRVDAITLGNGV